jgi:hypothetical protein
VNWARKLPVEPFPFLDGRYWHVDRAKPDRNGHEKRGRRDARLARAGFNRKGREIARDPGKKRDL